MFFFKIKEPVSTHNYDFQKVKSFIQTKPTLNCWLFEFSFKPWNHMLFYSKILKTSC